MERVNPEFLTNSRLRMYGGTTNHFGFWAIASERYLPRSVHGIDQESSREISAITPKVNSAAASWSTR
jgi:hypothetical protein